MADGTDRRDCAIGDRPHHDLFIEGPQILDRAAATRNDEHVRPRERSRALKAANSGGDFLGGPLPLHLHGPEQHMPREAVSEPVQDVAYVSARRSEEHTSELQSLMRISYAVFCSVEKNDKG